MPDDWWLKCPAAARLRERIRAELPADWPTPLPADASPREEADAWVRDAGVLLEAAERAERKRIRREARAAYYRRKLAEAMAHE